MIRSLTKKLKITYIRRSPRDTLSSKFGTCPACRKFRSAKATPPTKRASSCVARTGSSGGMDHRKKAAGSATPARSVGHIGSKNALVPPTASIEHPKRKAELLNTECQVAVGQVSKSTLLHKSKLKTSLLPLCL